LTVMRRLFFSFFTGTTSLYRHVTVYAVKVSAGAARGAGKPRFLQTATVHRDEVVCYMHTLHMIDTLLSSYGTDTRITRLQPLYGVKVTRDGDIDSAEVYTDSAGAYCRFVQTGTYTLTFSHPDYNTKTISGFTIDNYLKKYELNIQLSPLLVNNKNSISHTNSDISIVQSENKISITLRKITGTDIQIGIYDIKGKLINEFNPGSASTTTVIWDKKDVRGNPVCNGCYIIKLDLNNRSNFFRVVLGL